MSDTHPTAPSGLPWIRRPGALGLTLGTVVAVASGLPTLMLEQAPLGVMLILLALDVLALYAMVEGFLRLRSTSEQADAAAAQGRGWWRCELPVFEHRYRHVRASEGQTEQWICRRCGHRRYTAPKSFADTVSQGAAEGSWVRRDHEL
ncbi:hypothetical protein J2X46_000212 [Nocardioides sp. BE266]|uniref:hypothetical protein n=1 Tax=Nocardioides sp. BE266 TaxID=2817725 RepID=UPI0028669D9B|nr:hypothetical protein [Nocardioides sp. BE266]MDR7251240.1 hypothetical protein [Nocardioides sp. BE266]